MIHPTHFALRPLHSLAPSATRLALVVAIGAVGCSERTRPGSNSDTTPGPAGVRCQNNDDCSEETPYCVGGRCSAETAGGEGEGEGELDPSGEGEGEGEEGEGEGEGGEQGGDGSGPAPGELCGPCEGVEEGECGNGGRCILFRDQNKYCSAPCDADETCPPGFECVSQWEPAQCLPLAAACLGNCAVEGCENDGEVCDFLTGVCGVPKEHCEPCQTDDECVDGGCAQLQDGKHCVRECEGGQECPPGSSCAGTFCMPDDGICDRCQQRETPCEGLTAYCDPTDGECKACLEDQDCGPGSYCALGECRQQQGECLGNGDCVGNPNGLLCFVDRCVECIANEHCPPRSLCNANVCESALCEGVQCQGGAACNANTGKCDPSCEETGCLDGQECDIETGQCYNSDGTCDVDSPCRPGSVCGGGGGLPGQPQEARCTCPNNIVQCASADDCPGFPGGCNAQFNTCEVGCAGGNEANCPEGWECGGFLCQANAYCHPGITCGGGACGGGGLPF